MCGACAISSIWKGSAEQRASLSGQAAPFFFPETGLLTYPNKEWDVKRETTTPLLPLETARHAQREVRSAARLLQLAQETRHVVLGLDHSVDPRA